MGLILGSRKSHGAGNGIPFQCSCLENSLDRGAWWARVHGVEKSQTWLRTHTWKWLISSLIVLSTWTPTSIAKRLLHGQIIRVYGLDDLKGFHSDHKGLLRPFPLCRKKSDRNICAHQTWSLSFGMYQMDSDTHSSVAFLVKANFIIPILMKY